MSRFSDQDAIRKNMSHCLAITHCLKEYGASRLDLLNQAVSIDDWIEIYVDGRWSFVVMSHHVPFILGACLGLSNKDLSKIILSLSVDPVTFIQDFNFEDEVILCPDGTKLTGISLNTKMIDLMFYMDSDAALLSIKRHFCKNYRLAAAFLGSGHAGGSIKQMLNAESLAAYSGEDIETPTVQSVIGELPLKLRFIEDFPNGSIDEYLKVSQAFNPHIVKKTLDATEYWENIFTSVSEHYPSVQCRSILEHVFSSEFSSVNKNKLGFMLSNIAMEFSTSGYLYDELFGEILRLLKNSAVANFSDKTTFHLSLLRGCLERDITDAEPLYIGEILNKSQLSNPLAIDMLKSLMGLEDRLLEQVMRETLDVESHCIGFHLLSLPSALTRFKLPAQKVERGLFEQYLVKMAEAAANYTTENDCLGAKQDMDNTIHAGMTHWLNYFSTTRQLDTRLLDRSSERAGEQLVYWGVDIHSLPAPSDKAMTLALERDMGL